MKHPDSMRDSVSTFLPAKWNVQKEGSDAHPFSILDSYGGALLSSGKALLEFPGKPSKVILLPDKIEARIRRPLPRESFSPTLLPHSELRNIVESGVGAWRLGRRGEGIETVENFRMENEERTGIARIILHTFRCENGLPVTAVEVRPYRGHGNEAAEMRTSLEARYPFSFIPSLLHRSLPDPIRALSESLPDVRPDEEMPEAVLNLGRHILSRIRLYEPGIGVGDDPEVLHQYRVSIRRMRSLLFLLKKVFSHEEQEAFRSGLKSAMQQTNRLRDMDVQMTGLASIRPSIPDILRPGLDRLIEVLGNERALELESVRNILAAAPFEARFAPVAAALEIRSETVSEPIAGVLTSAIAKHRRRIAQETSTLGADIDPGQLHSLRVSFKKLRYLMDFFPRRLDRDLAGPPIKRMKKLQDLLGKYNDLCVREAFLLEQAKQHRNDSMALMALGAVIMQTHRDQRRLVKRCVDAALDFDSAKEKAPPRNAVRGI